MPPCILTVDDSKTLRLFVEKTLGAHGCECVEANNGFNAFFAIERQLPDLILLDISMPVMDGVEMLRRLKTAPDLTEIPVVMLASPANHALLPEIRALGASDVVMKPFTAEKLLELAGRFVKLKQK